MAEHLSKIRRWLYPLSWLYGTAVQIRNKLFDRGILRSKSFNVPVICIGNLAVGGTGKTPHTEYLIRLLTRNGFHVAVLSRGYKRKSKGYILAGSADNAQHIGDEPYQMKSKFPNIHVAVDEDRVHGIGKLLQEDNPRADVILLDDAFQHRKVKAGLNILLTDYHRLWCDDTLLPAGNLREPIHGKNRAQIVIVTKCPPDIKPIDFNIIGKRLDLYPYQQLYFSGLRYGQLRPVFPATTDRGSMTTLKGDEQVLLVTGIASPAPLLKEIQARTSSVQILEFGDHHDFSRKDLQLIDKQFRLMPGTRKLIITTEKDSSRLKNHPALPDAIKPHLYILPIEVKILQNQQQIFNQNIINYVRTYSRNSQLPEGKDAHTA